MNQIITNLMSNALKFTQQGEIIIKVTTLAKTAKTARLNFSVTDTGIGMSKALVDRIFSAFDQADTFIEVVVHQ